MIDESDYRPLERFVHWLALEHSSVRELSFFLDRFIFINDRSAVAGNRPVYVCGLARSGTTMLLRLLESAGCFSSATYRHMPFVLAPNLWALASKVSSRQADVVERAHKDGVMVGYDSPEAFEEVFWQTFSFPVSGVSRHSVHGIDDRIYQLFSDYRALVVLAESVTGQPFRRYLSKNNNNISRFEHLAGRDGGVVLLLFRDPYATAVSLHRQHLRFSERSSHPFVRRYMAWLGHHEFGDGHLPFGFVVDRMEPGLVPSDLNYWLDYWICVYSDVLGRASEGVFLVDYDNFCLRPDSYLECIFERLGVLVDARSLTSDVRHVPTISDLRSRFDSRFFGVADNLLSRLRGDSRCLNSAV